MNKLEMEVREKVSLVLSPREAARRLLGQEGLKDFDAAGFELRHIQETDPFDMRFDMVRVEKKELEK